MKNTVSIILVCHNSRKFLARCLGSLTAQTWRELEVILVDNNSADGACKYARESFPRIITVENSENLGYAAAANQGIRLSHGEFVMVLNPDIILEPDYVEKCVRKMNEEGKIAAITGKLFRYDFERDRKTNIIDTVGLLSFRNRRIVDEGQGEEDMGQYDRPREVFGVSGACPLYRRTALEDVKVAIAGADEYFDEDFFMYKEDVDLSWRLRLFGWKCFCVPSAVAHHGRGTGALKRFTHLEVLKNRARLNRFQKYFSYKNQRLMQAKNELCRGFFLNFFPIAWKEMLIGGYMLLREPFLFKAFFQLLSQMPRALRKRRFIMRRRRAGWREMEKWLSGRPAKTPGFDNDKSGD